MRANRGGFAGLARSAPARTLYWRAASLISSAIFGLANTRLILDNLGAEPYALIALVLSLAALLPFADLGLGAAVVNTVAEARAGAVRNVLGTLAAVLRLLAFVAAALLLANLALAVSGMWPHLLGVSPQTSGTLYVSVAVALFILTIPLGLGQRLLLGLGQTPVMVRLQALAAPLTLAGTASFLLIGVPSVAYMLAPAIAALAVGLLTFVLGFRRVGIQLRVVLRQLAKADIGSPALAPTAIPMVVIVSGVALATLTDRLVLSHVSNVTVVAEYSLAAQLYAPLYAVISTAGTAMWPIFAARRITGSGRDLLTKAVPVFAALGLLAAITLGIAGPVGAELLAGEALDVSEVVFLAFAVLLFVQAVHYPAGTYLTDEPGLSFQASCVAVMLPANLVLSYVLAREIGAAGPVLASACTILSIQALPALYRSTRDVRPVQP